MGTATTSLGLTHHIYTLSVKVQEWIRNPFDHPPSPDNNKTPAIKCTKEERDTSSLRFVITRYSSLVLLLLLLLVLLQPPSYSWSPSWLVSAPQFGTTKSIFVATLPLNGLLRLGGWSWYSFLIQIDLTNTSTTSETQTVGIGVMMMVQVRPLLIGSVI